MPGPFPRPAPPGTVPADRLAAVEELHAACRTWCEHIPQHLPYADLTFAFGFALLGDAARARRLLDGARVVMVIPVPAPAGPGNAPAAVVRNFLFRAYRDRTEQAIGGRPHT